MYSVESLAKLKSIAAERSLLASILSYQGICNDVAYVITPEMFFDGVNGRIFRKCVELETKSQPVNLETVLNELTIEQQIKGLNADQIANQGLATTMMAIAQEYLPSPNYLELAEIVKAKYLTRKYFHLCEQGLNQFLEQEFAQAKEWFDKSLSELQSIAVTGKTVMMGEVMAEEFDNLADLTIKDQNEPQVLLPTGFDDLDNLFGGGIPRERMICVLGDTGMAKTTLGLELLRSTSLIYKQPSLFFSLEMGKNAQAQKLFSKEAKISTQYLQAGNISQQKWSLMAKALEDYRDIPMGISDRARTIEEIISTSRAFHAKYGSVAMILIDYLTLIKVSSRGFDPRMTPTLALRELNQLKKDLQTRIVVLCQIGRSVKDRQNKRPQKDDAKETGEVEECSDLLLGCYRDEYYNPDTADKGILELSILKSRYSHNNGGKPFRLIFDGENSSIYNLSSSNNYESF